MRCCTRHSIQIQTTHTTILIFFRTIFVVSIYSLCMCFVFVYVGSPAFVLCAMITVLFRHLRRGLRIFQYFLEWKSPPPERRENPNENKKKSSQAQRAFSIFVISSGNVSRIAICVVHLFRIFALLQ